MTCAVVFSLTSATVCPNVKIHATTLFFSTVVFFFFFFLARTKGPPMALPPMAYNNAYSTSTRILMEDWDEEVQVATDQPF